MKKVAIVTPGILPVPAVEGGGVETLIQYLIDQNEENHSLDIDLYTLESNKYNLTKYKHTRFYLIRLFKFQKNIYSIFNKIVFKFCKVFVFNYFAYKVKKIIKKNKYDIIIVENGMSIFNIINKSCYTKEFIYHLHNDFINDNDKNYKRLLKICNKSKKVLVVSQFLKNKILKINNSIKNVEVLNNVVDMEKFDYKNVNIQEIDKMKKKYSIENNDFVFLYSGRIVEEKGVIEIIDAFNKLKEKYENVKLIICGLDFNINNDYEKQVYNKIQKQEKIINAGFVDNANMPLFYSLSHCVILTTKIEEAFGLSALETLAMKKILIFTNSGELPNLVNNYGFMIEKDNITMDLINTMQYILNNKEEANRKACLGYEYVHNNQNFNMKYYLKNFVKAINDKK